ncbi:type IV secretion system DNA-binding domain-containing protein, partial [Waterburya agarophytonicola K14]
TNLLFPPTKLILNCRDPHTAKAMAEIIGHQEVIEEFVSDNGNTISTVREKYAVMPSEIQNLIPLQGFSLSELQQFSSILEDR